MGCVESCCLNENILPGHCVLDFVFCSLKTTHPNWIRVRWHSINSVGRSVGFCHALQSSTKLKGSCTPAIIIMMEFLAVRKPIRPFKANKLTNQHWDKFNTTFYLSGYLDDNQDVKKTSSSRRAFPSMEYMLCILFYFIARKNEWNILYGNFNSRAKIT